MKSALNLITKITQRLAAFFGLPLIFVFISYLVMFLILNPVVAPMMSLGSMLFGNKMPSFSSMEVSDDDVDFVNVGEKQDPVIHVSEIKFPKVGKKYAHITIPNTGVDCDVYYGDDMKIIRKGPGQFEGSKLPGFGSTTLVAAHVTTHFKGLQYVNIGDKIYYTTTYGAYEYEVTDILVVKAKNAKVAYDLRANYDNLVLYTCYPFHAVAFRAERYFVCAKMISGPKIDVRAKEEGDVK